MRTELAFRYGKGCGRWHKIPVEWPYNHIPQIGSKVSGYLLKQILDERMLSSKQVDVYTNGISRVTDVGYDYEPGQKSVCIYLKPSRSHEILVAVIGLCVIVAATVAGYVF